MDYDNNADNEVIRKKEFDRELANAIWIRLKGHELPDTWDEGQVESIIKRYWHRAIAYSEGY